MSNRSGRTRLPTLDLVLVFLACGFLIAALFSDGVTQGMMLSVSASFAFYVLTRLIEHAARVIPFRRFNRLFTSAAVREQLHLVYPDFVLHSEVATVIQTHVKDCQKIYTKRRSLMRRSYRIDIPHCVAMNDIEAMTEFVGMFGKVARVTPPIQCDDEAVEEASGSIMSFGLSSNEFTHMFLDRLERPLFALEQDRAGSRYGEYLRLTTLPVSGDPLFFRSTDRHEVGLFVKQHPERDSDPDRAWMLCAGVGPQATIGVAKYMVRNWQKIERLVGAADFIVIVEVPHYSPNAPRLLCVATAEAILEQRTASQ